MVELATTPSNKRPGSIKKRALKEFLSHKFSKLKEEGYEGPQRTAIALNMARRKGYKVPGGDK